MKILGIDPGSAQTGWGIIQINKADFKKKPKKIKAIDFGTVQTHKDSSCEERLQKLYNGLVMVIREQKPDIASVEQLFFFRNAKTVITVAQARGVILLALAKYKVKVLEYTPLQIKLALTGYGRASKPDVQKKVKQILKLKDIPRPNHAADALAAAICSIYLCST